jgi:hypothetical protein
MGIQPERPACNLVELFDLIPRSANAAGTASTGVTTSAGFSRFTSAFAF